MIDINIPVCLASKSPRRRKLLKQIGINFSSTSVDLDEEIHPGELPLKAVKRLAMEKMDLAKRKISKGIIITADTIVVLNKKIIGKPKTKTDAVKLLKSLSGNTHSVYTGFAVYNSVNSKIILDYEKTAVTFNKLSGKMIKDYVVTGSPMDKAGAYGIQDDFGSVFVKKVNGCYYNVVGLPIPKLYQSILKVL
jgi:septum formation protein